jgi:hypothetical protein
MVATKMYIYILTPKVEFLPVTQTTRERLALHCCLSCNKVFFFKLDTLDLEKMTGYGRFVALDV